MDKNKKYIYRSILFQHLDGIVITPVLSCLYKQNIINYILVKKNFTLNDLESNFKVNLGYLNISLRLLASQGFLIQKNHKNYNNIAFKITKLGKQFFKDLKIYSLFFNLLPDLIKFDEFILKNNAVKFIADIKNILILLDEEKNKLITSNNIADSRKITHLEGFLIGPILVSFTINELFPKNMLKEKKINFQEIKGNRAVIKLVIVFLEKLKWITNISNKEYQISDKGLFFFKRATSYGVTVSYLPTFLNIDDLIFGNPNILWKRTSNGMETHVNRSMNVWGSGGAHKLYFKKIDDIIIDIFNKPIEKQPKGISDMGCGDGTMLKHLFDIIKNKTIRGKHLDKYPIKVVGADFNKAAREASRKTLFNAEIDHLILHGNISEPSNYAYNVKEKLGINLKELLNVRSFLDHNRIYTIPKNNFFHLKCNSTGAFAFRGRMIPNNELKQNLIEHFESWSPYISKYGLLILELHTIDPLIASKNIGKTIATAYDATHGFSDQYIFEINTVQDAAKKAGLTPKLKFQSNFPRGDAPTISINLYVSS
tara:strand:- start:6365 stop:7984 length:1620 start_codon:yes stop_codon:yes gene_type:complete